jgi:hypothetical protein
MKYLKQTMFLVYKIFQYSVLLSIIHVFTLYYHFPKYVLSAHYAFCL